VRIPLSQSFIFFMPLHSFTVPSVSSRFRGSAVWYALWLALAPATAIGFGRFAYALVLPAMRSDLGWTYAQAGTLNTANALGYLLGAILAGPAARKVPSRSLMLGGLAVSVVALLLAGLVRSFALLLACRALVGTSAAFTFIATTGLVVTLGENENEKALALGLTISGPGLGAILSGILTPLVLGSGVSNWPHAWWLMAALGGAAFIAVWLQTRDLKTARPQSASQARVTTKPDYKPLLPTLLAYFLFGLGYIAYMTFLVAYVRSLGASAGAVALTWSVLGTAMIASAFVWRRFLSRNCGGRSLALMGFGGACSALLPLASNALPLLLLSAACFGLTSMPVFAAVTMLLRRQLPPEAWTSAIALATTIFAVGQSLGPLGSGLVSDHYGPRASLIWTFGIMFLGAAVACAQRPKDEAAEV
jgi:predicted MFS family arabinose efflux permease